MVGDGDLGPPSLSDSPFPCLFHPLAVSALSYEGQTDRRQYETTGKTRDTAAGAIGTNKKYGLGNKSRKGMTSGTDSHTESYGEQKRKCI